MKDDFTVLLIDSINRNDTLNPAEKLELVSQTLRDCKQKKIGKIVLDAIESKNTIPKKRGRPRKAKSMDGFEGDVHKRTPNQEKLLQREKELEVY